MKKNKTPKQTVSLKLLAENVRGYIVPSVLAPLFVIAEVVLEVLIPREMGRLDARRHNAGVRVFSARCGSAFGTVRRGGFHGFCEKPARFAF